MTREQLIDIAVDTWSDTEMDLLMNILETPTEEQQKCEYCHEPYNVFKGGDRVGFWFNSHNQLRSPYDDAPNVLVNYCPMCGRKLGDDE